VLRPGAVSTEALESIIGKVRSGYKGSQAKDETDLSGKKAGQKYGHYTPDTEVVLVEGEGKLVSEEFVKLLEKYRSEGQKVGFLLSEETAAFLALRKLSPDDCFLLGTREDPGVAAGKFFEGLRKLDRKGLDVIVADGSFNRSGLGEALINRLREASSTSFVV
jgi:L-threonylcarbamoyladenylate synthase